ncbi:MAG: hypothetical protein WKH64_11110 [Chloroflexia bacterium]
MGTVQDEEEAMAAAASVMRRVWRPVPSPHSFPTVAEWAEGFERLHAQFDGGGGPMPVALVERAEAAFADLIAFSANRCCSTATYTTATYRRARETPGR